MFFKQKSQERAYGNISTSVFDYITPFMIFIIVILLFLVGISFDTLLRYYETNIPLNSLIIGLMLVAFARVMAYNLSLYDAARYISRIDEDAKDPHLTTEDLENMKRGLETKGRLFNTSQMAETIDAIERFGSLIFTDLNSRLIKSKIGFRISSTRSGISFLTGILVMLGLIGTFLGLLTTIDAVGDVLAKVGASGTDSKSEGMGGFIGSLSAPLQGMGLAFSSSLFGLSGSLLVGFFNYLSGGVHNNFIEHVSRWIDDRIPKFDPTKVGEKGQKAAPNSDDLKTWLMGFVYLANENNRKMGKLFIAMAELVKQSAAATQQSEAITAHFGKMSDNLDQINNHFSQFHDQNKAANTALASKVDHITEHVAPIAHSSKLVEQSLSDVKTLLEHQTHALSHSHTAQHDAVKVMQAQGQSIDRSLSQLSAIIAEHTKGAEHLHGHLQAQQQDLAKAQQHEVSLLQQLVQQGQASTVTAQNAKPAPQQPAVDLQPVMDQQAAILAEIKSMVTDLRKAQALGGANTPPLTASREAQASQPDLNAVMLQLNSLMEEIKQKSDGDFFDILEQLEKDKSDGA